MLIAYLDEVGDSGAFVSADHTRYKTSPAFGYAGYLLPDATVRRFGSEFVKARNSLLAGQAHKTSDSPLQEIKGADMFRPQTPTSYPQNIRVFKGLAQALHNCGGQFFYYADEKPRGTPKQVNLDVEKTEYDALTETLNRLCRHADNQDQQLLILMDQVNEKTRKERLSRMYAHTFSRTATNPEMRRLIEPPMHMDSHLSANIQFADWVAAAVSRAVNNQLIRASKFDWVPAELRSSFRRRITNDSKIRLWRRDAQDIYHIHLFDKKRPLHEGPGGYRIADRDPEVAEKMERVRSASHNHHPKP